MKKLFLSILPILFIFLFNLETASAARNTAYVSKGGSTEVSMIDVPTDTVIKTINLGRNSPFKIAVSPNGKKGYITVHSANKVVVIDTVNNTMVKTINVGEGPYGVAISPDSSRAYVANSTFGDDSLSVIDTSTDTVISTINIGSTPTAVVVSPDGNKVYVTRGDSVAVIDAATNRVIKTITGISHNPNLDIAVSSSLDPAMGYKVYIPGFDSTLYVIATVPDRVITTINVGDSPYGVTVSPDGKKAYVSNNGDNTISVINTETNAVTATIPTRKTGLNEIEVSPDGSKVYASSSNGLVVIDTSTNTMKGEISINAPSGIAFK